MVAGAEPLIIGHRGAPGYRPEHTRASYELALAQGVDAVEPDLVASRDGVLLIRHENEISGTTDVASRPEFEGRRTTKEIDGLELTGWFTEDFSWAELSTLRAVERLPRLRRGSAAFDGLFPVIRFADLLSLLGGVEGTSAPGLVVELKHPTYFTSIGLPLDELLEAEIRTAPWWPASDRLVVESFEKSVLRRLQRRAVAARYVYLLEASGTAYDLALDTAGAAPTYAEELTDERLAELRRPSCGGADGLEGLAGISVNKDVILEPSAEGHRDVVSRAHALGLDVFCWTLRPENRFLSPRYREGPLNSFGNWRGELNELIDAGVNGVFMDHPDLARRRSTCGSAAGSLLEGRP
jgi:glycerophosphoryl diester phosphodiesterase